MHSVASLAPSSRSHRAITDCEAGTPHVMGRTAAVWSGFVWGFYFLPYPSVMIVSTSFELTCVFQKLSSVVRIGKKCARVIILKD